MTRYHIKRENGEDTTVTGDDELQEAKSLLKANGEEYEVEPIDNRPEPPQNGAQHGTAPIEPDDEQMRETFVESPQTASQDAKEAEVVDVQDTPEPEERPVAKPEQLSKDPIGFLERINEDFTNTIKGKPAISKQGFRFIQREFKITTESEVVEWSEDPLGCVVWAKAELDDGYSAEAHGEGYQFESGVSDNEFVRMADTRAKNRAISDLTAAGALAVEELTGESDG